PSDSIPVSAVVEPEERLVQVSAVRTNDSLPAASDPVARSVADDPSPVRNSIWTAPKAFPVRCDLIQKDAFRVDNDKPLARNIGGEAGQSAARGHRRWKIWKSLLGDELLVHEVGDVDAVKLLHPRKVIRDPRPAPVDPVPDLHRVAR